METNEALTLILSKLDNLKQDVSELKEGQARLEKKMDDGFALTKNQITAVIEAINVTDNSVTDSVNTLQKQIDINSSDIVKIRAAM